MTALPMNVCMEPAKMERMTTHAYVKQDTLGKNAKEVRIYLAHNFQPIINLISIQQKMFTR